MIAVAATLFVACAGNDTFKEVEIQDVAIGFSSQAVNKVTRAEITLGQLKTVGQAFGVYGFKGVAGTEGTTNLFTNEKVTYQNVSTGYDDWRHPTVRFWDKSASNYNFYAYAPYGAYNVTWDNSKGFSFTGLPIIQLIGNNNADIVVANAQEGYSYAKCATDHTANGFNSAEHPTHDDPANGYVPFIFNHVLSKLSFKVKTHADYSATAKFTVKKIELNFPSLSGERAGVAWNETNKNDVAGTTTYTGYTPAETTGTIAYETEVYNNTTGQVATTTAAAIGNTFIVTPKNESITGHQFDIKVTYDVQYSDNVKEENCVATGTIAATTYKPAQNEYWTITIDINPEIIEFCVDKVNEWTPVDGGEHEVK